MANLLGSIFQEGKLSGSVLKSLIAGIVIFAGIAGGIYTGMAFSGKGLLGLSPEDLPNNTYLDLGERFPNYTFWNPKDSSKTMVAQLTRQGPTLLVFVSANCGACQTMAGFWKRKEISNLRDDIQIALIYDKNELMSEEGLEAILDLPGSLVLGIDRSGDETDDGISATPTFVALNTHGKIEMIMTGFRRDVGSKFINELL